MLILNLITLKDLQQPQLIIMLTRRFLSLAKTYSNCQQNCLAFFSKEENSHGVKFDEEQIKRKMQEIKQRKEEKQQKLREPKFDFMEMNKGSQIAKKIRKYRQATNTQNLLRFADPTLETKPTSLQITGYDDSSIEIDQMTYPPSMIIFPQQMLVWEVPSLEQLKIEDFLILKYVNPKPTYVIVGVNNPDKFPNHIRQYLSSHYPDFDVLEMFSAVSQFNVTSNDDINVVAFLLAKS